MECHIDHRIGHWIEYHWRDLPLFRYVYGPDTPREEARRPYFHPVRTLNGQPVTIHRPHDHRWHHGLSMTCADLSGQNFWGGPTYVRGEGYTSLGNHGRQVHSEWVKLESDAAGLEAIEQVEWADSEDCVIVREDRRIAVPVPNEEDGVGCLDLAFELRNVTEEALVFGSPTTNGRPSAGYGGLFWRGLRSFRGGRIEGDQARQGEELMGCRSTYLALVGRHDATLRASTVIMLDLPGNPRFPTQWFVRSDPYACMSASFMFDTEFELEPDDVLGLHYRILIAAGDRGSAGIRQLAQRYGGVR